MKDDAHTPGPWIWADGYRGLFGAGPYNAVLEYEYCEGMWLCDLAGHAEANALLIAAAPDMIFALRAALKGGHLTSGEQAMCAAAVEKATGRSIDEVLKEV